MLFAVAVLVPAWLVTLAVGGPGADASRPGRMEDRAASAPSGRKAQQAAAAARPRPSKRAAPPKVPAAAAMAKAKAAPPPAGPAPTSYGTIGTRAPGPIALGRFGEPPAPASLAVSAGPADSAAGAAATAALLAGTVTDGDGRPVEGASVDAVPLDEGYAPARGSTTDAGGRYALSDLEPGAYRVFVSHPSYRPAVRDDIRLEPVTGSGPVEADFRLETGPGIAGRVVGPGGEPVPGATVTATLRDGSDLSGLGIRPLSREAATDDAGLFRIAGLPPGAYAVSATADAYLPLDGAFAAVSASEAGADAALTLRLDRGLSIEGAVFGARGDPLRALVRARVDAIRGGEAAILEKAVETGPDGRFVLAGLPAGAYDLEVAALGGRHAGAAEAAVPAGSKGLRIVLPPGGALAGRARDAATGEPLADVRIAAERVGDGGHGPSCRVALSGEDGSFAIEGLEPGTYAVRAEAAHRPRADVTGVAVAEGGEAVVEIVLGTGAEVRGRVVAGPEGDPVPGATVFLGGEGSSLNASLNGRDLPEGAARTDAEGRFVLRGVPFGRTRLSARAPGRPGGADMALDVAPGTGVAAVELRLP